jgi:hypothetical protein
VQAKNGLVTERWLAKGESGGVTVVASGKDGKKLLLKFQVSRRRAS